MPAAIIGAPSASVVTEDRNSFFGLLTAVGTISIRDPDPGQQRFRLNVVDVGPTLGDLVLLPNGTYIYLVSNQAIQFLGAGETRIDTFRVTAADGTTANVSFTIVGANDAAVIGNPTRFNVTEDLTVNAVGQLTATGTISIRDADQNQSFFQTVVTPAAGVLGTLTLAADGSYSYAVSNAAVQFLGAGESRTDVFTIRAADGTSKTVSFVIAGRNDAAVIGDLPNASVTEDGPTNAAGQLTATGVIAITDADQGQASFRTTVAAVGTTLGALVIAANGAYTYTVANAAVQFLNSGETRIDSFVLTALDGTTRTVSFTINGRNEGVLIGDPTVSTVVEDGPTTVGNLTASGTVPITAGASFSTVVTPAAGNLGSLTLAAGGAYTYSVANDAVQFLGAGQTRVESFTIRATDGTEKQIGFTITGANDAAVIGAPSVSGVTEDVGADGDGLLTATGIIGVSDPDQNQSAFQNTIIPVGATLGALSLAANGAYTYGVNNSLVQSLGAGATRTDSFTVTSLDGTTAAVSFTITGANDTATITGDTTGAVAEDGTLAAGGTLTVADVDSGEAAFATPASLAGTYGGFTFNATTGAWGYALANTAANVQGLKGGQTVTDTLTVTSLDNTDSETITVTIAGANDTATITGDATGAVAEDGTLAAGGTLTVADVDAGEAAFATPASLVGTYGSFTFNATTGAWGYTLANAAANVQALAAGRSVTDTLTVTSLDNTDSETITVTIAGANDAVTISPDGLTGTVVEDGAFAQLTATSNIVFSDIDLTDTHTVTVIGGPSVAYGELFLSGVIEDPTTAEGRVQWTYVLDNAAAQQLAQGQSIVETYTIAVADAFGSTTASLTITIEGSNDLPSTPTYSSAFSTANIAVIAVPENTAGTIATFAATDIDLPDTLTFSLSGDDSDDFTIDATSGAIRFTTPPDFEAPTDATGDNAYQLRVFATDSSGGARFTDLTVQVTNVVEGGNLAPVAAADSGFVTTEETAVFINAADLLLNDSDPNLDPIQVVSVFTSPFQGGGNVTLNSGIITYTPGLNTAEGYNGTQGGSNFWGAQTGPGFFYTIRDTSGLESTAFVRVQVANVNDAVVAVDDRFARTGDTTQSVAVANIIGNDANPDPNPVLTITAVVDAQGNAQTFADDRVIFNFTNGTRFTYTVQDEGGSTDTGIIDFNSAPIANSDPAVNVSEAQQQGDFGADVPGSDYIFIPASVLIGNDTPGAFDTGQTLTLAAPSFAIFGDAIQEVRFNLILPGAYVFLKQGDFSGEITFNYRVFDNGVPSLTSNDAGVQLIVAAGNDTPIALRDGSEFAIEGGVVTVAEDGTVVIGKSLFLGNDYDEEGRDAGLPFDGLTIAAASSPFGDVTFTAAGDVAFTPTANYNSDGAVARPFITYQVSDGQGGLSVATQLFLDVIGVDDPVDARDFTQTYGEQTNVFIPLSSFIANTTAPDGTPRLLSVGGALGGGVALVDSDNDGIFEGATFAFDGSGPFSFTYEMADPDGDVDTGTVTLEQTALQPFVLYFSGDNGDGRKLWAYDPMDGFYAREELPQGFGVDNPELITAYAGQVVFEAAGDFGNGLYLYGGDPNLGATLLTPGDVSEIQVVGNRLFAVVDGVLTLLDNPGSEVVPIADITEVRGLWNQDGTLYFTGRVSDGGVDTTDIEQVFRFDAGSFTPEAVTAFDADSGFTNLRSVVSTANGAVFFAADVANPDGSDGVDTGLLVRVQGGTTTTFGTTDFEGDQNVRSLIAIGNEVFFIGTDIAGHERLWVADDSGSFTAITDLTDGLRGSYGDADNALTARELVAFDGGVLVSFAEAGSEPGDIALSNLYFTNGDAPITALDPTLFQPDWVQVVDGEAYFISSNRSVEFPDFDTDGREAYVFDGTSTTLLTNHAPFDIQELRVESRDRLFLISDAGNSEVPGGSFIYEYNPREFGSNETVAIPERARVFDALFDGGDNGLHVTLRSANGLLDQYFFIDAATGALQFLPADTFALGTNDDRGFVGGAPYRYQDPVFGPELSVFQGVVPGPTVDALPGNTGIAPSSIAQSFDGETLYTSGSKLNDITGEFERFVYRIIGDTATPVTGLIGETTAETTAFFYELSATSGGATVIKGVFDKSNLSVQGFEYWYIDGATNSATLIDGDIGFFGRTGRAEVNGILFYEDQTSEPGTSKQLGRFDPATGQTSAITINLDGDADVRELVAVDGGVYLRAVTQGVGFDGDLELVRVEADGSFNVIELRPDLPGDFLSSAPRQITAVNGVLVALGDTGTDEVFNASALYEVDWVGGEAVIETIELQEFGIGGVPFLEGGAEVFNDKLYFFADNFSGDIGLYSYDPVANAVTEVLLGNGQSEANTFDYQMEVAAGRLWFTFEEGQGEGMELYSLDAFDTVSLPLTNFNAAALGYNPSNMAIVEPAIFS